jgi:translation initiation factor 2B subunit (eIF-2B alpha/beta/delta family)
MDQDWKREIILIAQDHDSGSWALAIRALSALEAASEGSHGDLYEAIQILLAGQPAMAALYNVAHVALGASLHSHNVKKALEEYLQEIHHEQELAIGKTLELVGGRQRIVTISASSIIENCLQHWERSILIFESRPRNEGAILAQRLSRSGCQVSLAVDAACHLLLKEGDVVLIGADSLTPAGVTNKIGSWHLAMAAQEKNIPVFVVAGREKWWPEPLQEKYIETHDPREVLENTSTGITIINHYFEVIPFSLVTLIISGKGILTPQMMQISLKSLRISADFRDLLESIEHTREI